MKTANNIKKIAALAALVVAFGIGTTANGQTTQQAHPVKTEAKNKQVHAQQTAAKKETQKTAVKAENEMKAVAKKSEKKVDAKVKEEKKAVAKTSANNKTVVAKDSKKVKNQTASAVDKKTGEKHEGHTIYEGPRGGRYYINANGNKTYITPDKK